MLDLYSKYKEILTDIINEADGIFEKETTKKRLIEIKSRLIENSFYLVILGQFKRGKSTFINALIGENLLPTSIVPLTSISLKTAVEKLCVCIILYKTGSYDQIIA